MTRPETTAGDRVPEPGSGPDPGAPPADPESPWHGIPAALLNPDRAYDTDTAGGCG